MDEIQVLKDTIRYTLSDWKTIFLLASVFFMSSFLSKFVIKIGYLNIMKDALRTIFVFISVGYGSYISLYTIEHKDNLPKLKPLKKIIWEGFKKSLIVSIYFLINDITHYIGKYFLDMNRIELRILFYIMTGLVYILLVLALSNRYLHDAKFSEAFNFKHIYELIVNIKIKKFIPVVICVFLSQIFVLSVFITFTDEITLLDIILSLVTFLLTPLMFVFNKRLSAAHISDMFDDIIDKI